MTSETTWRIIDTGLRNAAENIAFNQALLQAQQQANSQPILRFLRFKPSALIGFHQAVEQELHIDYCKENNIEIQRRITGGGAIYFDETQLGWELYFHKSLFKTAEMHILAEKICQSAVQGLNTLGINAMFRPRNDIEVEGKKISGTGGAFDGDAVLYQGTLLIDFDIEKMLKVLRIPAEKLSDKAIQSAKERVTSLKALLNNLPDLNTIQSALTQGFAKGLNINLETSELTEQEELLFQESLQEIDNDEWIYQRQSPKENTPLLQGLLKTQGGLLKAIVWLDKQRNHIKQIWIYGDFFIQPKRLIVDLEAALKDIPASQLKEKINNFFNAYPADLLMLKPDDFIQLIENIIHENS